MCRPSGAVRACSAWAWVITPSDSISLSTRLRRRSARSGLSTGENATGPLGRPASSAASVSVRSLACFEKKYSEAASKPYIPLPR